MFKSIFLYSRVVRVNCLRYKVTTKKMLELVANMPKSQTARVIEVKGAKKFADKFEKNAPTNLHLQVIGSGAHGASNALYLFSEHKRYLFNCGEGTQRIANEHKIRLSKLNHIFITHKTWKNIGGLPGLSLSLQKLGSPKITLHGPDGLDVLYYATKRFVMMKDMNVTMAKCSSEDYEDEVMSVKYVFLEPNTLEKDIDSAKRPRMDSTGDEIFQEFIHDDTDYYVHLENSEKHVHNETKDKRVSDKLGQNKAENEQVLLEPKKSSRCSVAYICTLKSGPNLDKLNSGQDVVLPDERLVLSKDVKTQDIPGSVFIVIEIPEISYLNETEFSPHFDNGSNPTESIPSLVVHFTPPHVFHHPTYKAFMSKFGACARHMVLNSQNSCLGSEAVHRMQYKLHLLDPLVFPLLKDISIPANWNTQQTLQDAASPTNDAVKAKALEELKNNFQNILNGESCKSNSGDTSPLHDGGTSEFQVITARSLTKYHLKPHDQLDRSAEPKLQIQDYYKEVMDVDGFMSCLKQFRSVADSLRHNVSEAKEYPRIVFLGTGSTVPSKERNTSGILLQVEKDKSILLDCSEGTFSQMVRFFGAKGINAVLRSLKAIYISHLHADHHLVPVDVHHRPLLVVADFVEFHGLDERSRSTYLFQRGDYEAIRSALNGVNWTECFNVDSLEHAVDIFYNELYEIRGLIGVLQARREAYNEIKTTDEDEAFEPVYLLAPGQIIPWLHTYNQEFEKINQEYTLIPNQLQLYTASQRTFMTPELLAKLGVKHLCTCRTIHCPNSFGVAISIDEQNKVTYSGDTLPCEELITIGQNSSVLIHEATLDDRLEEETAIKMHSTTSQAIQIGRKMAAKYTVLTHFGRRRARLPRFDATILDGDHNVIVAFDHMQITMSDLEILPYMIAPLRLMFAERDVQMEVRAGKKSKKRKSQVSADVE